MISMRLSFGLWLAVFSSCALAGDNAWPIFRGDSTLSGVAAGKVPDKPSLLWSFKTGGPIKSSPVIGKDRVYIGSNDGKLYALSLKDGAKQWELNTGGPVEAPPLLADNVVIVGAGTGSLFSVDAATGASNWIFQTGAKIAGSANCVPGIERKTKWILVGSYDNSIYCVDLGSGKKVWSFETGNYINGTPASDGKRIIFGGCDSLLHILSASDGKEEASVNVGSYIPASATLADDRAFVGHYGNKLVCVDLTAKKVLWEYMEKDGGAPFFSSPAVSRDKVVIGSRDGKLHCVSRKDGTGIWVFTARADIDSSPVICGDKVIVGSADGRLYIVNLSDGTEAWSYEIGAKVASSPAVAGGMIIIGADDGNLYAFGKK